MKEKQEYIKSIYQKAMGAGLCRTVKEFAALIDFNRAGLSSAMNGDEKSLTDSLVKKVRLWAQANGLEESPAQKRKEPNQTEHAEDKGVYIPHETMEMYTSMAKALENMSAIIRATGAPAPSLPTQKNFPTK